MKITPVAGPMPVKVTSSGIQSARERAIAALAVSEQPAPVAPQVETPVVENGQVDQIKEGDAPSEENKGSLSTRFADLARKEMALRSKLKEQQAKEDELKAREAALQGNKPEWKKGSILKQLSELGVSYDDVVSEALQLNPQEQSLQKLRDEIRAEYKAEIEALKQEQSKSYTEQEQQALNHMHTQAKHLVETNEAYELIKATDSTKEIVKLIKGTWEQEGRLLSVEEAAEQIESELLDQQKNLVKLKKLQGLYQPKEEVPAPVQQGQKQLKTLTNSVGTSKKVSARERAIAAFSGKQIS